MGSGWTRAILEQNKEQRENSEKEGNLSNKG
jgi:hypothetical protein